ncbi:TPA: PerC family transcriptional regulator [Klebsiella variicola]|nr:PerC family transcriptional regulator [Klebsiella variicola]HBU5894806.1 PerC family transcriptional regulator [Klebsiella variicola]
MIKQSKTKVTKAQMVLAIVSRTPVCVLQDVCDALDLQASTAGNLLRQLHAAGKLHRTHNGCQYVYRVVAGVEVPNVALPQAAIQLSEEDVKKIQDALSLAKTLEDKKLWRRAATVYTSLLGMSKTANELYQIAQKRTKCLRKVRRL